MPPDASNVDASAGTSLVAGNPNSTQMVKNLGISVHLITL